MSTTVEELVARLGLDIDGVAFAKADALLGGLRKSFFAFGTAALGGLAVGAVALAKSTAEAADHARKLAQATGVNSITLQEFGYAAQLSDVSMSELGKGLQHLAKKGVKDVQGELFRLADQFKAMPDDGRKVQLAMEKFGRAGARMIPLLNGGSESLRELAQEAHDLGVVFSEEDQIAAEEFNDNITRLGKGFAGLRNAIGNRLIPVLNKLVLGALGVVKALRAWKPELEKVMFYLKGFAILLGSVVLAALVANSAAIATTISWYAALGVAAVVAAVKAAAAWLLAAAPAIALTAAFALLLLILEDVYQFFTDGDSLLGALGPKWTAFLDNLLVDHEDDFWLVRALKAALRFITDIQGGFDKLGKAFDNSAVGKFVNSNVSEGQERAKKGQLTAYEKANGMFGYNAAKPDALLDPTSNFGGGASPAASVSSSVNASRASTVNAPSFKADITVNAAPGMDAKEVAGQVAQAFDAHFDAKVRGGDGGLQ